MSTHNTRFLLFALLAGVAAGGLAVWPVALVEGGDALPVAGLLQLPAFLGAFAGALAVVLLVHPALPELSRLTQRPEARWRLLALGPLLLVAWVVAGYISLEMLATFGERPELGGLAMALISLGLFAVAAMVAESAAAFLGRRWEAPNLKLSLLGLVAVFGIGASALILVGETSGAGHLLALFGVFKRDELNLVPVVSLAVFFLAGVGGSALFERLGKSSKAAPMILMLCAMALLGGLAGVSSASGLSARQAVEIERSQGLGRVMLFVATKLTDRDGDGASSAFGGGDCNDSDPSIHPGAIDIPGNGIDEDCRGGDAKEPAPTTDEQPSRAEETQGPALAKLPENANLVILTIDTMRADIGYTRPSEERPLSPRIDELVKRSTVFDRAYSLASYTPKSLGPFLIGRYGSETHRNFEHFDRYSKNNVFVQERVQKAGIATASVQGYWYFFFKGYGLERGWDILDSEAAPKHVAIEGDRSITGEKVADRAIARLGELSEEEKRFFMWVHWVDPHAEYMPHEGFDFGKTPRDLYDGEVAFADAQLGRVLDALEKLGLAENTVIIVSSDHGEAFGEHGMIRHGFEVWEELVHVPLIVHVPGAPAKRVNERRSHIDIAATVVDLFDVDVETGQLRGKSLLADALLPAGAEHEVRPVLVDMAEGPFTKERRAWYSGDYKLITSKGRVLGIYDLSEDPGEKSDLSDNVELSERLLDEMTAYLGGLDLRRATK